MKMYQATSI